MPLRKPPTLTFAKTCRVLTLATIVAIGVLEGCQDPPVDPGGLPTDAFDGAIVQTSGHPGWTPGQPSVQHDGSVGFTVPIAVPAGRNGVQPSLALSYNSRRADGLVGRGWTIDGLSQIHRCPRTVVIDSAARDVEFDDQDALCIDGERLVGGGQASFWGGGTYRRWRDGYERIDQVGGSLSDSTTTFEVRQRDGSVWTYGGGTNGTVAGDRVAADSAGTLRPTETVTYSWLLTRIEDRYGNYLEVQYGREVHPDLSVENYPTSIRYTGHADVGPGTREVVFEYAPRPDRAAQPVQWIRRLGLRTSRRLSRVRVFAPMPDTRGLVREYRLQHDVSGLTYALRLNRLEECDGSGTCREPLFFRWSGQDVETRFSNEAAGFNNDPILLPEDDQPMMRLHRERYVRSTENCVARTGTSYSARTVESQLQAASSIMSGCLGPPAFSSHIARPFIAYRELHEASAADECSIPPTGDNLGCWRSSDTGLDARTSPIPFDFDRDGNLDYLRFRFETTSVTATHLELIRLQLEEGPDEDRWSRSLVGSYEQCINRTTAAVFVADLDGNGVGDLIQGCDSRWSVRLQQGDYGQYGDALPFPLGAFAGDAEAHVVEWDGDAGAEVLVPNPNSRLFEVHELDADGAHRVSETNLSTSVEPIFLDSNGDGLTDVAYRESRELFLRLNVGGSVAAAQLALDTTDPDQGFWDGTFRDSAGWSAASVDNNSRGSIRVADVNRDGRDDVILLLDHRRTFTEACDNDYPSRCLQSRDSYHRSVPSVALANLSDGTVFHPLRFGDAGVSLSSDVPPVWSRFGLPDLDGDGLADLVFEDLYRPCTDDAPLGPGCDPGEKTDAYALTIQRGRFLRAPDQLDSVDYGDPEAPLVSFAYRHSTPAADDGACAYPSRCVAEGLPVAADMVDALGRRTRHLFSDPVARLDGSGFVGFGHHYVEDTSTGAVIEYRMDNRTDVDGYGPAFAGMVTDELSYVPLEHEVRVHHTQRTYEVTPLSDLHHAVLLRRTEESAYEVPGVGGGCFAVEPFPGCEGECRRCEPIVPPSEGRLSTSVHEVDYDDRASIVSHRWTNDEEEELSLTIVPEHRPDTWLLGLPSEVTIRDTPVDPADTRERRLFFSYDARGFLEERRVSYGDDRGQVSHYTPNAYGLVTTIDDSATDEPTRTSRLGYDPEFVHVRWRENAMGHITRHAILPGLDVPVLTLGVNGVESRARYDGFGRLRRRWIVGQEDAFESVEYRRADDELRVLHARQGHFERESQEDFRGLLSRTLEQLPGRTAETTYAYDDQGRVVRVAVGGDALVRTMTYDAMGRLVREGNPVDGDVVHEYDGLASTRIDRRGNRTITRVDSRGRPRSRTVFDGSEPITVSMEYGAFNSQRRLRHSGGAVWEYEVDSQGRLIRSVDPDAGVRVHDYNARGELERTLDGSGAPLYQVVRRDLLGRVEEEWSSDDGTTTYTWDGTNGIGRLSGARRDGVFTDYTYDELTRLVQVDQDDGVNTWRMQRRHDNFGRIAETQYPSLAGPTGRRSLFRTRNRYATGVARVVGVDFQFLRDTDPERDDPDSAPWREVWEASEFDPLGRVTQSAHASGIRETHRYEPVTGALESIQGDVFEQTVELDPNNNVSTRTTQIAGIAGAVHAETFGYDSLNRMDDWTSNQFGDRIFEHDALGNLITNGSTTQRFGERGAGPHQVTSVGFPDAHRIYEYDSRGRRIRGPDGEMITSWTAAGLPRTVTTDSGTTRIRYDAMGSRVRTEGAGTVSYFGELYELHEDTPLSAGRGLEVFRIYAEGRPVAEFHHDSRATSPDDELIELHIDHQGSVVAATDDMGRLRDHSFYDAYGQRLSSDSVPRTSRGYTGHEHDDETGFVHMRGRMFDPTTAQFLSVDPLIRDPLASEALNGYSYVENNPGTWTDPSGLCPNGCPDELSFPEAYEGLSGAGGFLASLAAWLASQSQGSGADGGGVISGSSGPRGSGSRRHRRAPAPPTVVDVAGTQAAETMSSGNVLDTLSWAGSAFGRGAAGAGLGMGEDLLRVNPFTAPLYFGARSIWNFSEGNFWDGVADAASVIPIIGIGRNVYDQVTGLPDAVDQVYQLATLQGTSEDYMEAAGAGTVIVTSAILTRRVAAGTIRLPTPRRVRSGPALQQASPSTPNTALRICFPAGTLVATPEGATPIENLREGDVVLSYDQESGAVVEDEVSATFQRASNRLIEITLDDGTRIRATETHPFWTVGQGWVHAQDLEPGTELLGVDASTPRVRGIRRIDRTVAVYNLEASRNHNYFAGEQAVLVHNQDVVDTDFNRATNEALAWLRAQGVNTGRPVGPNNARFGPDRGRPNGVRFEGGGSYRIEFDSRHGAHINVSYRKVKGPHIRFEGNQNTVNRLIRRLFRC